MRIDATVYKKRRAQLRGMLASFEERDTLIFCGAAEDGRGRFVQDSTFFYYTGLNEPGAVLCIEGSGIERLFVPRYDGVRAQWVSHEITTTSDMHLYGVDSIEYQGGPVNGYMVRPFQNPAMYAGLIDYFVGRVALSGKLYVDGLARWHGDYGEQLLWYIGQHIAHFSGQLVNVSLIIASMRRHKDEYELSCIRHAITRTAAGHRAAEKLMHAGRFEYEVRGALEAEFMRQGSEYEAFPSIVATGVNATILHYLDAKGVLQSGDGVVVDVGATYNHYAADITRTYFVDGKSSARQRELYQIVLDAQAYVASCARPGVYLRNNADPDNSLQHKAKAFLEQHKLAEYMPHSIGHFMGLDVHDVGDYAVPLQEGDVITIEPGVYIAAEKIGIRIEDNYLITATGIECLSSEIEKELIDKEGY